LTTRDFDTPVNQFFAYELRTRTETKAEVSMPVRAEFIQGEGYVQGGIISALADAAAVATLRPQLPSGRAMTSIEFKINFLKPASADAGDLIATASVVRSGRTVAVCDVEVMQQDNLVAKGLFTYLFIDSRANTG